MKLCKLQNNIIYIIYQNIWNKMTLYDRKIIRLQWYDYKKSGAYFVTFCTYDRINFFGEIDNNQMALSKIWQIADTYINDIQNHYPYIRIDEYIIMPNHIHIIIFIENNINNTEIDDINSSKWSLSSIIWSYKSACTKTINEQIKSWNINFTNSNNFWRQRRYHDHIIRNDIEYQNIKNYIINNPKNRKDDKFHK